MHWKISLRQVSALGTSALVTMLCLQVACSDAQQESPGSAGAPAAGSASGGAAPGVAGTTSFGGSADGRSGAPGTMGGGAPGAGSAGAPGAGMSSGGQAGGGGGAGTSSVAGAGGAAAGSPAIAGAGGSAGAALGGNGGARPSGGAAGVPGGAAGAPGTAGSPGSGGAPSGFQPCPATGPCKVLPLGDSITDGIGFNGGYRVDLFRRAREDDKDITFVGRKMNGPDMVGGTAFPKSHEGYSGYTIDQIDMMVPAPALDPKPNIVLLHLGTNDMARMPNGATARLGTLIDQIVTALPDSLLVVSSLIPLPLASSQVTAFNAEVPKLVADRAGAGKHVIYADQFTGFPDTELGDGVHPNQAGYARMAGVWYAAIKPYLP